MSEGTVQQISGPLNRKERTLGRFRSSTAMIRYHACMTAVQALLLGLLQGFTELLPVSSSGHLALGEQFFALQIPQGFLGFDVLLHFGSLLALLLCYHKTWVRILRSPFVADRAGMRVFMLLIVVTIPAGFAGMVWGEAWDAMRSPFALGMGFLVSAAVLLIAERVPGRRSFTSLNVWEAL